MLVGLLFDDRGNPMSPSHANKKGVRYRYYVSHALLQNRKSEAGTVSRVSAPDVEQLVCDAVRNALNANDGASDRDLIRARGWMETILSDQTASFDDIAANAGIAERHVRRLAVLAFLSPKVIQAIADGAAPSGVTVSSLTQALPHAWTDQERMLGLG